MFFSDLDFLLRRSFQTSQNCIGTFRLSNHDSFVAILMSAPSESYQNGARREIARIKLLIKFINSPGQEFGFAYSSAEGGPMSSTVLVVFNVQGPFQNIAMTAVNRMMNYMCYRADQENAAAVADGQVWSSADCECSPLAHFNFMLIEATKEQVAVLTDKRAEMILWRSSDFDRSLRNTSRAARSSGDAGHRIFVLVPMKPDETVEDYGNLRAIAEDLIRTSVSAVERRKGLFGTEEGGGLKRRVVSPPQCANCSEDNSNLKLCSGCHQARYCSRECQVQHWPVHKLVCRKCSACGDGEKCSPAAMRK